jgi:hypothetical protein
VLDKWNFALYFKTMKTMFLGITAGKQESLWINSGMVTTDQKIVPFLNCILSVTV